MGVAETDKAKVLFQVGTSGVESLDKLLRKLRRLDEYQEKLKNVQIDVSLKRGGSGGDLEKFTKGAEEAQRALNALGKTDLAGQIGRGGVGNVASVVKSLHGEVVGLTTEWGRLTSQMKADPTSNLGPKMESVKAQIQATNHALKQVNDLHVSLGGTAGLAANGEVNLGNASQKSGGALEVQRQITEKKVAALQKLTAAADGAAKKESELATASARNARGDDGLLRRSTRSNGRSSDVVSVEPGVNETRNFDKDGNLKSSVLREDKLQQIKMRGAEMDRAIAAERKLNGGDSVELLRKQANGHEKIAKEMQAAGLQAEGYYKKQLQGAQAARAQAAQLERQLKQVARAEAEYRGRTAGLTAKGFVRLNQSTTQSADGGSVERSVYQRSTATAKETVMVMSKMDAQGRVLNSTLRRSTSSSGFTSVAPPRVARPTTSETGV